MDLIFRCGEKMKNFSFFGEKRKERNLYLSGTREGETCYEVRVQGGGSTFSSKGGKGGWREEYVLGTERSK